MSHYVALMITLRTYNFHLVPATVLAEFYASLKGIGVIWYRRVDGAEVVLGICALSRDVLV
jgi:hypothetical protein